MTDDVGLVQEESEEELALRGAVRAIGGDAGIPSFKKLMTGILGALDSPTMRRQELAALVTRDYSLSLKLTRTANSAIYNRSGRPVANLDHVIFMLGGRIIRELASTIMYFNEYGRRAGLRELLLLSLLRASVARELAIHLKVEAPESRFLAGMFHDLGQVLVASHFSTAYQQIRTRSTSPEDPDPKIVREVLGFEFSDLGQKIGAEWGLPDYVILAMARNGTAWSLEHQIILLSHDVTVAAFAIPYEDKPAALEKVKAKHRFSPPIPASVIGAVLNAAVAETRDIFSGAGVQIADLRLLSDATMAESFLAAEDGVEAVGTSG